LTEKKSDCLRRPDIGSYCISCGYRMYFDSVKRKWMHDFNNKMTVNALPSIGFGVVVEHKTAEKPNPTGWKKDWGR